MSQEHQIGLQCSDCGKVGYRTTKNKKNIRDRLMRRKHCKFCGKHIGHKETKV